MILFHRRGKTVSENTTFKTILFLATVTLALRGSKLYVIVIWQQVRLTYFLQ